MLGYEYHGNDLRSEQVEANRVQAAKLFDGVKARSEEQTISDPDALTPVERRGEYWFKRDDLFCLNGIRGANGGKVRTMLILAKNAKGLVACGDRISSQIPRAAIVAKELGLPIRIHTASGALTDGMQEAVAFGAELVQHEAGYLNVVRARAREDAVAQGYVEVPWAVECNECIQATAPQAVNIPNEAKRLVVCVGSGMSLAGILQGLKSASIAIPVLGVMVGGSREKVEARLDKFGPANWRERLTLVESKTDFHAEASEINFEGVALDPFYEAKVIPFLLPGDCVWCVGVRASAVVKESKTIPQWSIGNSTEIEKLVDGTFDMVFSCPPYADLEVYSDNPEDLSAVCESAGYPAFLSQYREVIRKSVSMLKPNSFAVFVVGEVRSKEGPYLNFVSDTVRAFEDCGAHLYNEAILVTSVGSLPVRVSRMFQAGRKLGKTHQNVLVFLKGEPKALAAWPPCEFSIAESLE